MSDLTYHAPEPPARPFRKGDAVVVYDRHGVAIGAARIARSNRVGTRFATEDGRQWSDDGSWCDGATQWPFPYIRLAEDRC